MIPADNVPTDQLIGRRVAFKGDDPHGTCWHHKAGLKTAVVLRPVLSLSQKAELLAAEGLAPPELLPGEVEVPRLWVRADPCPSFPRGCELAIEKECLLMIDS